MQPCHTDSPAKNLKQQQLNGFVDLNWVSHYYRFITHTQQAIAQRIDNVIQIQKKLITAREELAQAARQTKILEKLKEKQKIRYEQRLKKLQVREQDEIGANIFLRSRDSVLN